MDLTGWNVSSRDPGHGRRLAFGYATGVTVFAVALLGASKVHGAPATHQDEDLVDVALVATVDEAPPPVVQAPPPQAATPVAAMPRAAIVAPTVVPTEAPPESDKPAKVTSADDEYADGKGGVVGGVAGGVGTGPLPDAAPTPPPPPPRPSGPINLPEDATPPEAITNAQPAYPEDARRDGVEATVVVKFVVGEGGEVTNVSIMRGHPLFDAAVLAAVRSWRYRPAMFQGHPIQVYRVARIPFKLKG